MLRFFGVFGNPIAHSKSPILHNYGFESLRNHLDFSGYYGRILLRSQENLKKTFLDLGLSGANITVPFKEEAFRQCDEVRGIASQIEACNTWVMDSQHRIIGYNTDAQGFYECICPYDFKNALIIGAGGSAKAIAMILQQHHIPTTLINRSSSKLEFFAQKGIETYLSDEFNPTQSYELIINTTSAGLESQELPLLESKLTHIFHHARFAFDLIYGKQTPFLALAQSLSLPHSDGKEMLIHQAALAFGLFCQIENPFSFLPNTEQIAALMRRVF